MVPTLAEHGTPKAYSFGMVTLEIKNQFGLTDYLDIDPKGSLEALWSGFYPFGTPCTDERVSECMSLAETCIVLEHCPEATEHDDKAWELDLLVLSEPDGAFYNL